MSSNFYTADGAAMSSKQDDWETPQQLFDELDAEFHFTLDAASTDGNAKCDKHYTEQDSAFNHSWEGRPCSATRHMGARWSTGYANAHRKPANQTLWSCC